MNLEKSVRSQNNTLDGNQVIIWLSLGLFDLVLSIISLQYGAIEFNPFLRRSNEELGIAGYGFCKVGLMVATLLFLSATKKSRLLVWLNIGLGCVCLYIIVMLVRTFAG